MARNNLKNLTNDQLKKRKAFSSLLFTILIAVAAIDFSLLIFDLAIGEGFRSSLFVPGIACLLSALPMYLGKQKIKEELQERESNTEN